MLTSKHKINKSTHNYLSHYCTKCWGIITKLLLAIAKRQSTKSNGNSLIFLENISDQGITRSQLA